MYKLLPYGSNHFSVYKDPHFPVLHFFASIIDRIQNDVKAGTATSLNTQACPPNIMILLADDDHDDRELFEEAISEISSKIKVKTVEDGFQLMHILKDANTPLPDILFLDLNMPGMNGKQCLREIKKDERLNKLPIVIYSTSSLMTDIKDTYSIGANYFIQKPNNFNVAISLIKKVFTIDFEKLTTHTNLKNFVLSIEHNK